MPEGRAPILTRLSGKHAVCLRGLVVLLLSLVLVASAQAQSLTINRLFNEGVTITNGSFYTSTNAWNNNGFTNISAVSVYIQLSSVDPPEEVFSAAGTEATLLYNITNSFTVYEFDELPEDDTSVNQTFALTGSFPSPGTNNDWDLTIDALTAGGDVVFDLWRLIVTGGAVTNGTIAAGAGGIISGTAGYTVTAVIDAGSGTGTDAVTAFVTNGQSLNFNGGVTGSGELAKTGGGTLTIGGASSGFTGTLNVEQGTAALTGAGTLASGTSINLSGSSSVFDISGMTASGSTNGSLAGVSGSSVVLGGKHLTIGGNNANTSFAGVISGSGGSFTKTGSGTLTLSGANTFTGALTVAEGKLNISTINNANTAGVLGESANAVVLGSSGQTGFLHYIGTANASDKAFTAASGGTAGIEVSNAATTLTLSGAIGGSGNVQKGGAGILHLSGNNTFSGTLSVHDGTLQIGTINNVNTAGVLGESANAVELGKSGTANIATLRYTGNSASSTKAFALVSTSSVAAVIDITNSATDLALSGVISGSSGLTKTGQGTLTLSGNNTFGGALTVAEGKLTVGTINNANTAGVLGESANAVVLGSSGQTGFLHYVGTANASSDKAFTAASGGTAGIEVSNAATTLTLSGAIDGSGNVQKGGAGSLHLTGNNTFGGTLRVHDGTLQIDTINNANTAGVLGNSANAVEIGKTNTSNTSTLLYTGGTASSTKAFTLMSETNAAAVFNVSNAATALTLSGAIGGGGRLEKSGAGVLVLASSNNYAGGTLLSAGSLRVGNNGSLGDGVFTVNGGTLASSSSSGKSLSNNVVLGGNVQFGDSVGTGSIGLLGTVNLGTSTRTLTISNSTTTIDGVISGTGGLTKQGSGTLRLTGANNYSGTTTLSAGNLTIDHASALGSGHFVQQNGDTLLTIDASGTIANTMSLYNVSIVENVTLTGAKTLNNATYSVGTGNSAIEQGVLSDNGGLTKEGGGELVLNGATNNTYEGATVVNAGKLTLANTGGNAIHSSSGITVNNGATLELGASNQIGNGIGLVLNGGTFLIGASEVTEQLGTLTLSADSTIDFGNFGSTLRQLTFASSAGVSWATNATLTITNWQGVARTSSEFTEIFFGQGGLNTGQLAQIRFANQNITGGLLLGSGELVPVPEPPVYAASLAILAAVGWRERRRLVGLLRRR